MAAILTAVRLAVGTFTLTERPADIRTLDDIRDAALALVERHSDLFDEFPEDIELRRYSREPDELGDVVAVSVAPEVFANTRLTPGAMELALQRHVALSQTRSHLAIRVKSRTEARQ